MCHISQIESTELTFLTIHNLICVSRRVQISAETIRIAYSYYLVLHKNNTL